MRRFVIGISIMTLAITGCAEATDGGESEAGSDIVTSESIPQEWLEDPTTPLGNVTIYADGERADRFTLYSHHVGERADGSCAGINSICANTTIARCENGVWKSYDDVPVSGIDCRHLNEIDEMLEMRLKELRDDDCDLSMRFDRFENEAGSNDPEPYTQPGESIFDGTTSGGSSDPYSPSSGTDGSTQPADDLDSTDGTTQPDSTSGGSTGGSTGGTSSGSSGSTSTSTSGSRSGGTSTSQPNQF